MSIQRHKYSPEIKLQIVREVLGGAPVVEVGRRFEVSPGLIHKWSSEYRANPEQAFRKNNGSGSGEDALVSRIAELEQKIGQLTMENDFLKKVLHQLESKSMSVSLRSGNR